MSELFISLNELIKFKIYIIFRYWHPSLRSIDPRKVIQCKTILVQSISKMFPMDSFL